MPRTGLVLALAFAAVLSFSAHAARFTGIVTHVIDGDTVWVRPDGGNPPQPVRLEGIDAPEICQPYGPQARKALAAFVHHRRVQVVSDGVDDRQRTLGVVRLGHKDVGEWMVLRGNAWSYRFRGDTGPYAQQEAQARKVRAGLWRHGKPVSPREFRVRHGSCKRG